MKKLFFFPIFLMGCLTNPHQLPNSKLLVDEETYGLSRSEVIQAINECEGNGTRAVMLMGKRRVSGRITEIVVDVTCAPKYKYF
jgi:hypothetical protein